MNWGWGDGGAGDNIGGTIGDVEERIVFDVVKSGPDKLRGWGMWDRDDRWWGLEGVGAGAWIIPSVEVQLENLKDCSGSGSNVLLINIIKG